jgi:hypothetical protein
MSLPSSVINKNIIKSIIACVVILQLLLFFWLPDYHTFVYGACLILLIISGGLALNLPPSASSSPVQSMLYKILYLYLIFMPLGFLQFVQLKYKDDIDHHVNTNQRYKTILYLVTVGLVIQTIVLYHGLMNHTTTLLYGSVLLSIVNLLLSGLLWRDLAFFVTDGFSVFGSKKDVNSRSSCGACGDNTE